MERGRWLARTLTAGRGGTSPTYLQQQLIYYMTVDIRQSPIGAIVLIDKPFVVDTEQVQNRRMKS